MSFKVLSCDGLVINEHNKYRGQLATAADFLANQEIAL
jgi:hypothetical protein